MVTGEHGLKPRLKFNRTQYLCWSTFMQASSSRAYCIMALLSNSSVSNVFCSILRVNDQVELFLLVIWLKEQWARDEKGQKLAQTWTITWIVSSL